MEILRRTARRLLGDESPAFRAASALINRLSVIRKEGFETLRTLQELSSSGRPDDPPRQVALKSLRYPILVRPATEDAATIVENVIREEWGRFRPARQPEWIIDAGAYIGDTTAYFLSRFPGSKAIALEPNPPSYEMARENLKPYGDRAILLKKGLFSAEQVSYLSGDGLNASIGDMGLTIDCTTVLSLLEQFAIPRLDILKMNIEGAEEAVFLGRPEAWLSRTDLLILETHTPQIESLVSHVLRENGFSMKRYRAVWYCLSKDSSVRLLV
jgi:FkbM family methyltransferase